MLISNKSISYRALKDFICDLPVLSKAEKEIFLLRCKGETLSTIGSFFGVSKERVRQLEGRAVRKLRQPEAFGKFTYLKPETIIHEKLGLSTRASHSLYRQGIKTLDDLNKFFINESPSIRYTQLMGLKHIGHKTAIEILKKLGEFENAV